MTVDGFVSALAFTTYVGAANWDATPEQRAALRDQVVPLLKAFKEDGKEEAVFTAIRHVMGAAWRPSGDWAETLSSCGRGDLVADG
jgi:hypothetical protein